jgi:hypothetical protein
MIFDCRADCRFEWQNEKQNDIIVHNNKFLASNFEESSFKIATFAKNS